MLRKAAPASAGVRPLHVQRSRSGCRRIGNPFLLRPILLLLALLPGCAEEKPRSAAAPKPPAKVPVDTHFVYARILEPLSPIERGEKYEDPLDEALRGKNAGEVTGGGSSLKDGKIEWIGIDLELRNLDDALILARDTLRRLGAPAGSVLDYERDGRSRTLPIRE